VCGDRVADATTVFIEREVAPIVQAVLNTPMTADEFGESVFVGFFR
jgi:hypothetical protein